MIFLPLLKNVLSLPNLHPRLGNKLHVLTPIIGMIASLCFKLPYLSPFQAHILGIFLGNITHRFISFAYPDIELPHLKKESLLCKYLDLIYIAAIIATIALVHLSVQLALASSLLVSIASGYFYMNNDNSYMNDYNHTLKISYY